MNKFTLLLMVMFLTRAATAQYKPVDQASTLKFHIKNLGFNVEGALGGFEGSINFDLKNIAASNFDVTINTATINTDNGLRDEHLKADGYFDVKNYPRIRLVSNNIEIIKAGIYRFNGVLTIKGKSKPLSFPFTASTLADGYLFQGSFKINRKDFGVGGTSTIADELEVLVSVTGKKSVATISGI